MVGEICGAHSHLVNPSIELDRPYDPKPSFRDVRLDQMHGHVSPPETRQQHCMLRTEIRQTPCAPGQDAVIPTCSQSRAVGEHKLDVVV